MNLMALVIATTITVVNPLNMNNIHQTKSNLVITQVSEGVCKAEYKEVKVTTPIQTISVEEVESFVNTLETTTMYATDMVRVRKESNIDSTTVHVLNKNDEVKVIKNMGEWCSIQYGIDICYVKSEYLSTTKSYSDEDYEMLAHLIFSETGSDWIDITCLYYTGSVVLNRVASEDYPNTIKEVIEQYGQYECSPYYMDKTPTGRCYQVAHDLLTFGSRLPENVIYQSQFRQGSKVYSYLDGTYYCCR